MNSNKGIGSKRILVLCAIVVAIAGSKALAEKPYEIWAIDQSNSPGTTFGGTLYVYDGKDSGSG